MSDWGPVLLSLVVAVAVGAVGCYALNGLLVMGGRSAEWLTANSWVFPAGLVLGCGLLAMAYVLALWPLVAVGGTLTCLALGRYVWLNV